MANLEEIRNSIIRVLNDSDYVDTDIDELINDALQAVAGGVLMPNGSISPALPDLYATDTLQTSTTNPYVDLPDDYQRNVFYISDSSDMRIHPVKGGGYYSFGLFMNASIKKDLSLPGIVLTACVKGTKLYYQGIPSAAEDINIQYYRKPATMTLSTDEPEGLPSHLAKPILKHYVLKEIFGEGIEDGEDSSGKGQAYHEKKFYEAMETMIRSLPDSDDEPAYYAESINTDRSDW